MLEKGVGKRGEWEEVEVYPVPFQLAGKEVSAYALEYGITNYMQREGSRFAQAAGHAT